MNSKFVCPECNQRLSVQRVPRHAEAPYSIVWCSNPRCTSDVAQKNGGSGPNEEEAYRSLLCAVNHEGEERCESDPYEVRERILCDKADHENDIAKSGGA